MFVRLTVAIVALATVALLLLTLRQQRFELGHDLVTTQHQIDQSRQRLWSLQTQLAHRVQPKALTTAMVKAQMPFEPLTPLPKPSVVRMAGKPRSH